MNPFRYYVDLVDTAAFQKVESRNTVGQYDAPIAPLLAPWIVAAPMLLWLRLPSPLDSLLFGFGIVVSVIGYAASTVFYYRRVKAYRRDLEIGETDLI